MPCSQHGCGGTFEYKNKITEKNMYAYIKGTVEETGENYVVLEAAGVGYLIYTNSYALNNLKKGETAKLYTHFSVREDDQSLYGFLTYEEKKMYLKLIAINGIGPKAGMGILSSMKAADVAAAVMSGNAKAFESVSGIGKKTAQRIVLELKEKVDMEDAVAGGGDIGEVVSSIQEEAVLALMGLGYQRSEAVSAVAAVKNLGDTAENLVLLALKRLAG